MDGQNAPHKSGERVANVIARAGLASRREAELWIAAGRIAVNDSVSRSPALNVTATDRVSVDGQPLPQRERTRLFLYHKPRGLMTTHADPRGRPTIFERLPRDLPRLISVGRLDFTTEGLLLLTNDGALARVLELPATGWLRRYRVRAHGTVTPQALEALRSGVTVSGIKYGPIEAALDRVQGSNLWLTFAIREGKNREVRNVLGHLGLTVTRLIRVSFGPFTLGELADGAVEEVPTRVLREQLGDKLIDRAGADFSTPIAPPPLRQKRSDPPAKAPPPTPEKRLDRQERQERRDHQDRKERKSRDHAWRAREAERPTKLLRRSFRGARRDDKKRQPSSDEVRMGLLKDRKGRRVAVERHGEAPAPKVATVETPKRGRGRYRAPDRSSGTRPRQPRTR